MSRKVTSLTLLLCSRYLILACKLTLSYLQPFCVQVVHILAATMETFATTTLAQSACHLGSQQASVSSVALPTLMGLPLQNPAIRPTFDTIKLTLADIANETFKCSLESASRMKRTRQQALLSQMLPSKVHVLKPILAPLISKSVDMHNYKLEMCTESTENVVRSFCACQSRRHAVLCALTCCINVPVLV